MAGVSKVRARPAIAAGPSAELLLGQVPLVLRTRPVLTAQPQQANPRGLLVSVLPVLERLLRQQRQRVQQVSVPLD
jgi:hypothetical protein